uniref:Uncharacterized protein n=1 Tax=Micrurus corallinus TaxID=54390 RepID=A0A2D4GZU5_MICCO
MVPVPKRAEGLQSPVKRRSRRRRPLKQKMVLLLQNPPQSSTERNRKPQNLIQLPPHNPQLQIEESKQNAWSPAIKRQARKRSLPKPARRKQRSHWRIATRSQAKAKGCKLNSRSASPLEEDSSWPDKCGRGETRTGGPCGMGRTKASRSKAGIGASPTLDALDSSGEVLPLEEREGKQGKGGTPECTFYISWVRGGFSSLELERFPHTHISAH